MRRPFRQLLTAVAVTLALTSVPAGASARSGSVEAATPATGWAGSAGVVTDAASSPTPGPAETLAHDGAWLLAGVGAAVRAERARAGLTAEEVPASATGELVTVPGSTEAPRAAERVRTVRVQVEEGLPADGEAFARLVMDVLNDERGWGHDGSVVFARTDGDAEISVVLASGATTDVLCVPLRTVGEYSCGRNGRAVLNAERWSEGAAAFFDGGGDITSYREYLVNHEVGHLLGHPHVTCPTPGAVAPVMVQQSISLGGCIPNGWAALAE